MSDDEAIGTFGDLWTEVVGDLFERHQTDRLAVGLSGGLDSRSVATAAAKLGQQPLTFSYGTDRNLEARTAAAVAHRLGLRHTQLPVTDDYLMPDAGHIVARLDGAHSPAEMYESWFAGALSSCADVLVNGAGGGPLWGDEKTLGLTDPGNVAARVWKRYAGAAAGALPYLSSEARADLPSTVRAGISESLAEWDLAQRADMTVFWRVANRQVRWGNMLVNAVRRAGLRVETPFLDSRFLRFAARLTPDQRRNGNLHLRVHREVFTATAGIPRSDDGNSPRRLSHVYWSGETSYVRQLVALSARHPVSGSRRATRHVVEMSTHALRSRTQLGWPANWWDERSSVFPIELWGRSRPAFGERLATLVESATRQHPLFADDALATAAQELRECQFAGSATALARIATAALWLDDYSARSDELHRLTPVDTAI